MFAARRPLIKVFPNAKIYDVCALRAFLWHILKDIFFKLFISIKIERSITDSQKSIN